MESNKTGIPPSYRMGRNMLKFLLILKKSDRSFIFRYYKSGRPRSKFRFKTFRGKSKTYLLFTPIGYFWLWTSKLEYHNWPSAV
jgi:hypothetical protein